jgi:hypothetical protein
VKISIRQVLASVAGAVVAATIASFFGVSGTIVGVAIGSAAATIGTAVVAQSIDRTHHAVRQAVVRAPDSSLLRRLGGTNVAGAVTENVPEADAPVTEAVRSNEVRGDEVPVTTEITSPGPRTAVVPEVEPRAGVPRQLNWRVVAVTSLIVFVLVLAIVTLVELGAGKPLADLFGGSPGNGTSLFGGTTNTTQPPASTTTTVPATTRPTTAPGSTTSTTGGSTTTTTTRPTTTTTGPTASTSTSITAPGASG